MGAGCGVVGVGAVGGVDDGAESTVVFWEGGEFEGFAGAVLGVPHCLGDAVGEAGHGVFPVRCQNEISGHEENDGFTSLRHDRQS